MQIFSNNKIVVGLFDNDQAVEEAVTQLQANGFDEAEEDSLRIIDEHRLAQETPSEGVGGEIFVQPKQGSSVGGSAIPFNPITDAGTEASHIERNTYQALTDRGLGDEEAQYYARQVGRGNSLVIIETTKERATKAAELMHQAGAKTFKS